VPRLLLTYATTHGHTAKIADHLAEAFRGRGIEVEVRDVRQIGDADAGAYETVVVAASLHAGHHQRPIVNWVKANRDKLGATPTLFLSVSLTAAEDTPEAREATQRCIDDFTEETGWEPSRSQAVAGALQYREYDVFTRVLMRLKMRQGGHKADPSQDHEYTDWAALDRLAEDLAAQLTEPSG
jgi:menaquinone-dependent protoporphyrinogen oxidase